MRLRSIEIVNLRVFKSVHLDFLLPDGSDLSNVTVFFGTNGSGKTSLLRAVALGLLGPVLPSSGMRPYSLVRKEDGKAARRKCVINAEFIPGEQDEIKSRFGNGVTLRNIDGFSDYFTQGVHLKKVEEILLKDTSPAFFLVGYAATRLVDSFNSGSNESTLKSRSIRYQRVAGLFEEHVPLRSLSSWFPHYDNKGRRKQIVTLLNKLLLDVDIVVEQPAIGQELLFNFKGMQLPFAALSDAYRAYIGWIGDMLFHICMSCPRGMKLDENEGIVLVDEIDLHVHPQWQRTIVRTLSNALPQVQFIFTTHSPLIAGSLYKKNTYVVSTVNGKSETTVYPSKIDVYGWSVDQILNSELFDRTPARNPQTLDAIRTASAKARGGDKSAAIDLMRILADGLAEGACT